MKKNLFITTILCSLALAGLKAQETLPLGWHSTDIGSLDIPGSTTWDPEAELFTLESTGDQSPGFRPDNVHFAYTVQSGNFEIITLVSYVYGMGEMGYSFSPLEEAGIMIREDLSSFSKAYYMSVMAGDGGIRYYVRDHEDQDGMNHPGEGAKGMQVPCWLKLKRIGNSFDSYYSLDGVNWTYSPDANRILEMNPTCYVGIFCRGNANYVELFGWENPNNESILSMTAEFEATRIDEIENIYTIQNPIMASFVNIAVDESYVDVSNVFGKLENDEIIYDAESSDLKICRSSVPTDSDSIILSPKGIGSCTMTLEGDVSSFMLVNKFPVFVWEAPEAWNSLDVGSMKTAGFTLKEGGLYTLGGSADASAPEIQEGFHYMHKSLTGDAEIIARISSTAFPTSSGLGGISFSADSIVSGGVMARLVYSGDGMARLESRAAEGDPVLVQAETAVSVPFWIRMTKSGTVLNASLSNDGETWTALGTGVSPDLGSNFNGGLVSGSNDNANLSILTFEQVSLINSTPAINNPVPEQRMTVGQSSDIDISNVFGHPEDSPPDVLVENSASNVVSSVLDANLKLTLTGLSPGEAIITLITGADPNELATEFSVVVSETLDEEWTFVDIGSPLSEGHPSSLGDAAYSIATFGSGIAGSSDEFSYLYKEKTGAQQIVAKVESIEDRGSASEAGIMFRESTDPGSLYIQYSVTAYEGIKLQYRWDNNSQPVMEITDPAISPPCWIKLRRDEYNYFSAAYSLDGETWIPHGEFSVPLELPPKSPVGLTATSGFNEGTSQFEEVDISIYTGIDDEKIALPVRVNHFPNPFTDMTTLSIDVSEQTNVQITLYNMSGMMVAELMNDQVNPGRHQIHLNASELADGTYYYRLATPDFIITNKIVKIR